MSGAVSLMITVLVGEVSVVSLFFVAMKIGIKSDMGIYLHDIIYLYLHIFIYLCVIYLYIYILYLLYIKYMSLGGACAA